MAILDIFSKRRARNRGELPDVFQYKEFPEKLRVQLAHLISDSLGEDGYSSNHVRQVYVDIENVLCREYGTFELAKNSRGSKESLLNFVLSEPSVEKVLDVVEICFRVVDELVRTDSNYRHFTTRRIEPDEAINDLNQRFRESGCGYQFESGEIVRVDSQLIHNEAVRPALALLRDKRFHGANSEFLEAHSHYRHSRHKDCLVWCLKAFESTMKSICTIKKWKFEANDTAKSLINTCLSNGLVPKYSEAQFSAIRSLLESGIPTLRNKTSGHGQGPDNVVLSEHVSRYALHLTASTLLYLVESFQALK